MTPEEFARRWTTRVQRYGPALRNELREIGQRALQTSKALMQEEIYSNPEDRWPSGKPVWVRTGALLAGEVLEEEQADTFVIDNTVGYAEFRHEAGKPGRRRTNRPAHWRDDMVKELQQEMPDRLHRLQLRILSGGS